MKIIRGKDSSPPQRFSWITCCKAWVAKIFFVELWMQLWHYSQGLLEYTRSIPIWVKGFCSFAHCEHRGGRACATLFSFLWEFLVQPSTLAQLNSPRSEQGKLCMDSHLSILYGQGFPESCKILFPHIRISPLSLVCMQLSWQFHLTTIQQVH